LPHEYPEPSIISWNILIRAGEPLRLAYAFEIAEDESPIFSDRAPGRGAELVALVGRSRLAGEI